MKRTSSGSDLSSKAIFDTNNTTPYVYMAPTKGYASSPHVQHQLSPAATASFRVHCGGGTVQIQGQAGLCTLPLPAFIAELSGDYLIAMNLGLGGDSLFNVPLGCIVRGSVKRPQGMHAHIWTFLCGCCFGDRDRVLVLDLDAPTGWLQSEPGLTGPARLCLFVRECAATTLSCVLASLRAHPMKANTRASLV